MQPKVFGRMNPVYDEKYAKAGGLHMTYEEAKAAMKQQNWWSGDTKRNTDMEEHLWMKNENRHGQLILV